MTEAVAKPVEAAPPKAAPPAEFPPPVKATIAWLNEQFATWYRHNPPAMPDRFTRREFGFMMWPERPGDQVFVRHRAYDAADRFHWYLQKAGPHSCYYSTAYYRRPGEMKMVDKEWLGAELIFDLDADHLAEAEKAKAAGMEMPLAEQLRVVKDQFRRLLDEFLFGDFGLGPDDVWISFSGSRGYHAHVVEPRLLQLDARARREVVDYVTGKVPVERGSEMPDLSSFIEKKTIGTKGFGKFIKADQALRMQPSTAPGWPGRLVRTLVQELRTNILAADKKEAVAWLTHMEGVGDTRAKAFVEKLDEAMLERIGQGIIDQGRVVRSLIPHILARYSLPLSKGETDEPVTADTKRLIRLPGSLHGKSGLRCVVLTRDQLDDFDPLRDAVAFQGPAVKIVPRNDNEATLGGERVSVKKGEAVDVPMAHAVFWCARQQASLAPR